MKRSHARCSGFFVALVFLIVLLLALAASPASAKQIHRFTGTFNAPLSDTPLNLDAKSGLAVNEATHDVYVADTGNHRIVEFSAGGAFIRAFGSDVGGAGVNVCTTNCQAGTAGTSPGSFDSPTFLAIDNSGGPSNGDVYVVDSATNEVSKFEADGNLVSTWGAGGQLDGSSAPGGPFAEIAGLAVGPGGELAVFEVEPQKLFTFEEDSTFIAEVETPRASAALGLSLDGEGNFFKINGDLSVQKFGPTGGGLGQVSKEAQSSGIAINPASGALYVDVGDSINVYVFNDAGEVISSAGSCLPQEFAGCPMATERFGEGDLTQGGVLAVDGSSGTVYAVDVGTSSIAVFTAFTLPDVITSPAEVHSTTSATLNGEVNPNEIALEECFFEYGETTSYGATAPCEEPDADEVGTGSSFVDVHADLVDLTPGATYHYRLVALNENGTNSESGDREFVTGASIVSTSVSGVNASAATLSTEINPVGLTTTYRFQYVSDSAFGISGYATATEIPVGGESIGSGTSPVARSVQVQGLMPSTTYHFRVLAENALGTVEGRDFTFTTQSDSLGFQLPDRRAWEMISPPNKHGARLIGGGEWLLQASADGNGLAYQSFLSTEDNPDGNRLPEASMNLAHREAGGSWSSEDITPPNNRVTPITVGKGTEYKFFNPDLSEALVEPRSGTPLSLEASERTPYLRVNTEPPSYTPLLTDANVPPGTEFGGGESEAAVQTVGVSPDFRRFALRSRVPLVEGAPPSNVTGTVYEWSEGEIKPIGVLPAGEGGNITEAPFVGSGPGSVRGAISAEGARVFWSTTVSGNIDALYVRDTEAEESARIDVKQPGATGDGLARPIFQGASGDGGVVFFTDSQQLTDDASSEGIDLYRCELSPASLTTGCATLTDISVPVEAGESAEVQGVAAAVSDDAEKIYFVAKGVLASGPNGSGDSAAPERPNLYLWQMGEGVRFIATLADEDRTDWGQGSASSAISLESNLTAAASPSSRYLTFMSQRSLTGYDNRDKSTGEPAQEVFRYDSAAEELKCVSCNPSGARPHANLSFSRQVDPLGLWAERPVAAMLPEATRIENEGASFYHPRAVLDNGRVFFNAFDSLTPADSNGQWDVYQYEPSGVGDCSPSSGGASTVSSSGGCVSLISSGTAEEEAAFFDASETGNDAFFLTPAQLSVLDEDHEVDIYDARVDGVPAVKVVNVECVGGACQSAAQAPSDVPPVSAAFNGAGNLHPRAHKRCPKGKRSVRRHGRVRCVAKKKHRKANGARGATR